MGESDIYARLSEGKSNEEKGHLSHWEKVIFKSHGLLENVIKKKKMKSSDNEQCLKSRFQRKNSKMSRANTDL